MIRMALFCYAVICGSSRMGGWPPELPNLDVCGKEGLVIEFNDVANDFINHPG